MPRGKQRRALFVMSRAQQVAKKEMEAARGFRHATHLHVSPPLPVALPVFQLRKSPFPLSANSPHCLWLHKSCSRALPAPRWAQVPGRGPQASPWAVSAGASPSLLLIPAAGWALPYTGTTVWLLHEPDWELIWLKSGHESPSLLFFFYNVDYFSIQLLTWLYKHLHWYHRGQNKGRNGGGCLNRCCWNKYSCNCTQGIFKINTQALRKR